MAIVGSAIAKENWHLNKQVPVAIIGALIIQTAGIVWWAATTHARLDQLENFQKNVELEDKTQVADRLDLARILSRIDVTMDTLEKRAEAMDAKTESNREELRAISRKLDQLSLDN